MRILSGRYMLLLVTSGLFISLVLPSTSWAVGSFDNAVIADNAITNYAIGSYGGQCRAFVNRVVKAATGFYIAYGAPSHYFKAFEDNDASRITDVADLRKGDIVQSGETEADSHLHTFIIIGLVSGNTFDVIDSNHNVDEKVDRYSRPVSLSYTVRAYRLGVVSGVSSSTDTFMVINSGGAAFANNVLHAGLTWQHIVNGDALKVAVGGNYMAVINGCGALFGKIGLNTVGWTRMTACGDARDVAVGSDGNYIIINGCGGAYSRRSTNGVGMDGWVQLTGCGDATAVSAGGKNIALINSGGTAYAAINWWGPLQRVSNYGDARAIAVSSGGMLMMINGCGGAYTNNAFVNGGWVQKAGCGDAVRIAVGGHRFALINSGGTAYATDTWDGGMTRISNPGDAREVSVGDNGTILMISGCNAAVANNSISVDNWYGLTGCGDALAIAG
jgi:hypothetical protein